MLTRLFRNDMLFEAFLIVVAIGFFGIILVSPATAVSDISPGYRYMTALAPDPVWVAIGCVMIAASLSGLLFDDIGLRQIGLGLAAIVWLVVGLSVLFSMPQAMGWGIYTTMSLFSYISYRKLRLWRSAP